MKGMGFPKGVTTSCLCSYVPWLDQYMLNIDQILDAPAHLKKELNTVLALQADIDTADHAIQSAKAEKYDVSEITLEALGSLECTHNCLVAKVCYGAMPTHDNFD